MYLRWVDDGGELFDPIHAQVGDGKGSSHILGGLQLPIPGLGCQRQHILVDGSQPLHIACGWVDTQSQQHHNITWPV